MPENLTPTQKAAVINPYALAELIAGRKIAWKRIPDKKKMLEEILQTPYEKLFDPKYDSPLYLGMRLNANLELERVRPALLDVEEEQGQNDLERLPDVDVQKLKILGDLGPYFQTKEVAGIPIDQAEILDPGRLTLHLSRQGEGRLNRLARVFTKDILQSIAYISILDQIKNGWTPPNAHWGDNGDFFEEAAEFFDPIQGAVANCYYIAALSAIAWARPYMISHMTRATGTSQPQFTNMIRFHNVDSGDVASVEVTDTIPLSNSTNSPIYARSSEAGEIWPSVYEKAFAKWVTGTSGDHPDITATAWGDPILATAQVTGLSRFYYRTTDFTPADLWNKVRENSLGGRTFNPMTALTYSSSDATPKKVVYSDANLVASHAYTILGWAYRSGKRYIILRNPWGSTEATLTALTGTVVLYDISWWRPIVLTNPDGVFAIEAQTFQDYFSWMGGAK